MTDHNAAEVARIAKGLTPIMKRELLWIGDWSSWFAASEMDVNGLVLNKMVERGLFERRSDPDTWGRSQYRALPLNANVRAHLEGGL